MTMNIKIVKLIDEYLPGTEDVSNIDEKNRIVIPSYYRKKTKTRLEYHEFPKITYNRFALIPAGGLVSVLDALIYEFESEKINKDKLEVCEVECDYTGRIIIPKKIYENVFFNSKSVVFKPSDDKMYFTISPT
jgi:bifunctional DNA-binding transcriptional regulator/antitoxin component of YhaV-PrlF toxin-antitoxin module